MNQILVDLSASTIVNAIESNLFELIKARSLWPRAEVHDDPELLWSMTDIPYPHFNLAMRTLIPPEQVDAAIQAAMQRGMQRHVPMGWWCGPNSRPATLLENLAANSFMHVVEMPCMAVDLQQLPEPFQTPGSSASAKLMTPQI